MRLIFFFLLIGITLKQASAQCVTGTFGNFATTGVTQSSTALPITWTIMNASFTMNSPTGGISVMFSHDVDGNVFAQGMAGVSIYSTSLGSFPGVGIVPLAENVSAGTDISALPSASFSTAPLHLYNTTTSTGTFGGGIAGYLAIRHTDGRLGFIELSDCGTLTCMPNEYTFSVNSLGFSQAPKSGVIASSCPSLLIQAAIPTLSQWGVALLALSLLIFSVVFIKRETLVTT